MFADTVGGFGSSSFGSVFGFGGDDTQNFGFSQGDVQDFQPGGGVGARAPYKRPTTEAGILPCSVASCLRTQLGDDAGQKAKLFGKEWGTFVLVGWIKNLTTSDDGIWTGQLQDCSGRIDFRYESRSSEFGERYQAELAKIRDPTTNYPVKMFGSPLKLDDIKCFMVEHMAVADHEEAVASHILEACWVAHATEVGIVGNSSSHKSAAGSNDSSTAPNSNSASAATSNQDPYNDELIEITNSEHAGLMPEGRLAKVIYRYLDECINVGDGTVNVVALKSFCRSKWTDAEFYTALSEMEAVGIVLYSDDTNTRVSLA